MDTWLTFVTVNAVWGQPADAQAAHRIEEELIVRAGRTGEPGIDPAAEHLHGDHIRIRQSYPHLNAFQAVSLTRDSLRRIIRDSEIVRIEAVRHSDWRQMGGQ